MTALFYNFGFFTLLAYTPFPLGLDEHGLGYVFFGWGALLAISSVFVAPAVKRRLGLLPSLHLAFALVAADLVAMGIWTGSQRALIVAVVVAGVFLGVVNTLVTETVMRVSPVERATASAAYSFVRFSGGVVVAGAVLAPTARWVVEHESAPELGGYDGALALTFDEAA